MVQSLLAPSLIVYSICVKHAPALDKVRLCSDKPCALILIRRHPQFQATNAWLVRLCPYPDEKLGQDVMDLNENIRRRKIFLSRLPELPMVPVDELSAIRLAQSSLVRFQLGKQQQHRGPWHAALRRKPPEERVCQDIVVNRERLLQLRRSKPPPRSRQQPNDARHQPLGHFEITAQLHCKPLVELDNDLTHGARQVRNGCT
mmetsp:Transcript_49347/g.102941  ORF Transcript_49347/g.102941 Transcript_49347/m.102941 type:complete len:202 (+) Transcript_49347:606-1211(+)